MNLRKLATLLLVALFVLPFAAVGQPTKAQPIYRCFPTCDPADGKFMVLVGTGLNSLVGGSIEIQLAAPAGSASFTLGIFDGDSEQPGDSTVPITVGQASFWDRVTYISGDVYDPANWNNLVLDYDLYADPLGDNTGGTFLGTFNSETMLNDDWSEFLIPNSPLAQSPSGNFFYRLVISSPNASLPGVANQFKLRTDSYLAVQPSAFQVIGGSFNQSDLFFLYPNFPLLTNSPYSGVWDIYLDFFNPTFDLVVWDGDLDRGKVTITPGPVFTVSDNDTDDPDTANVGIPPWAVGTAAVPEGVAVGSTFPGPVTATGNPADDFDNQLALPTSQLFMRSPSIEYTVYDPNGTVFYNPNPSGNQEWEQFRITSDPADPPGTYDYFSPSLPAGLWRLELSGLDLSNLNALRLFVRIACVQGTSVPGFQDVACDNILRPFLIGDTVWWDYNGNGVQDPGEPGIPGVIVELIGTTGTVIATTTTDASGLYFFNVDAGTYTVRVASSNDTNTLVDAIATTPRQFTNTVVNANILTYDFGFRLPPGTQRTPTPVPPVTTLPSTGYAPAPDGLLPWGIALIVGVALVAGGMLARKRRQN
ncbi:MAG: hypothetical protein HS103_12060 [Anaerolineales bacterium]|nr:hypothetical protein [Anaerolineales bacterium]